MRKRYKVWFGLTSGVKQQCSAAVVATSQRHATELLLGTGRGIGKNEISAYWSCHTDGVWYDYFVPKGVGVYVADGIFYGKPGEHIYKKQEAPHE